MQPMIVVKETVKDYVPFNIKGIDLICKTKDGEFWISKKIRI